MEKVQYHRVVSHFVYLEDKQYDCTVSIIFLASCILTDILSNKVLIQGQVVLGLLRMLTKSSHVKKAFRYDYMGPT